MEYKCDELPELLAIYYKRVFPIKLYYRWLSYGGIQKSYFLNREFSFTTKDDVYIRYLSFSDQNDFEKKLLSVCPYKIDIGAVFSHSPADHKILKPGAFQPLEKELVFDIDMTDYDDVRNCCSGADICSKCWPLMSIGVEITDKALKEDFGFEHLLWVYSGRRGVHCWVCDESARKLSTNSRSAIVEYLTLIKGGDNQVKKINLNSIKIHPAIERALDIIDEYFENYLIRKQDFLGDETRLNKVLALLPDELQKDIMEFIKRQDKEKLNSRNQWEIILTKTEQRKNNTAMKKSDLKDQRKFQHVIEEIKLQYCYPRLDVNVSKGINHLLKSPFCIHPKTGRICVPFDASLVNDFDPFSVPTISQICDELNEIEITDINDTKIKIKKVKSTRLRESIEVFTNFIQNLEKSWSGKLILENDKTMEF